MAKKIKELQFSMRNKVGLLDKVTESLKKAKVNILHIPAWSEGGKAHFQLVTNQNARAAKALRKIGVRAGQKNALVLGLQNRVGILNRVAHRLAKAKVNISCLSATTGGKRVAVILSTNNDAKASRVV